MNRMICVLRNASRQSQCLLCKHTKRRLSNSVSVLSKTYKTDEWTNITPRIIAKTETKLLSNKNHPLNIVKQRITKFFHQKFGGYAGSSSPLFSTYEDFSPVVSIEQNFDVLLIAEDHVARSKSDNYYINKVIKRKFNTIFINVFIFCLTIHKALDHS